MLNHLTLAKMGVKPNILNLVPFNGDSCFPLSPIGPVQQADQRLVSKDDQLKCILRKMGRLSAQDMQLTQDSSALRYLDEINPQIPKVNLSLEYKDIN